MNIIYIYIYIYTIDVNKNVNLFTSMIYTRKRTNIYIYIQRVYVVYNVYSALHPSK